MYIKGWYRRCLIRVFLQVLVYMRAYIGLSGILQGLGMLPEIESPVQEKLDDETQQYPLQQKQRLSLSTLNPKP